MWYSENMKTALYARVSTTDQNCESQLTELRRYAAARDWPIEKEYIDTGFSGAKASRPALDQLMKDALARRIDTILVYKLDRWGRSVVNMSQTITQLRAANVRFIAISQGIDTDINNPVANFQLQILAAVTEFERELIKERVAIGSKRYAAEFAAGRAISKSGKNLAPHRPKRIFNRDEVQRMRAEGKSWNEIVAVTGLPKTTLRRAIQ